MDDPLQPWDISDDNNNTYAEIYSNATVPTNPAPFREQVNQYLSVIRELNMPNVPKSAYLNKMLYESDDPTLATTRLLIWLDEMDTQRKLVGETNDYDIVFIWDIDEITMLSRNYLAELSLLRADLNVEPLRTLIRNILLKLNFEEIDNIGERDVITIEDAFVSENEEIKKDASMYDALRKLYSTKKRGSILLEDILEKSGMLQEKAEICQIIKEHQKIYNRRWKYAKKCVELANKRSAELKNRKYANVVLSRDGVAFGAIQLLLSNNSSNIPIENVYSTFRERETSVFKLIQKRFGENCHLVHVTSGPVYAGSGVFSWTVTCNDSIKCLYNSQRDFFLKETYGTTSMTKSLKEFFYPESNGS